MKGQRRGRRCQSRERVLAHSAKGTITRRIKLTPKTSTRLKPGDWLEEAILAERLETRGLDPKKVGERVVDAIRTKTFYAFVSAVPSDVIKARHHRIEEALNSPWVTRY